MVVLPLAVLGAVLVGVATLAAARAPEPDPVPRRWQLDVKLGPLRAVTLDVSEVGTRTFLYTTYTVTNTSAEDILFAPTFELSTSDGPAVRSGRDVPHDVTRRILESLQNPALLDQIAILGVLLQGDANAKEGLVIWPAQDLDVTEVTVYAAGFSGETRVIEVPDPKTKEPTKITLRKSLMTRYRTPGEIRGDTSRAMDVLEQRWVLR